MISWALGAMLKIVTIDSPEQEVLKQPTESIREDELPLAKEIGEKLFLALQPYFPSAGLAAPQIGIGKSIFIFSYDRDPKNLEVVINPTYVPIGEEAVRGWEGCFSVILSEREWKLANVPRYEAIKVTYMNIEGKKVEKVLEGFAAKVFQHEWDHLQGVENICREDAEVKAFDSREDLFEFMKAVKKEDAARYKKPHE